MNAPEKPKTYNEVIADLSAALSKLAYVSAVIGVDPTLPRDSFENEVKRWQKQNAAQTRLNFPP